MVTKVYGDTGVDKIVDGAVTSSDFAAGVGGKILQVVSTTKTDNFSTASTSFVDITGLSVSITPSSSANKILIMVSTTIGTQNSQFSGYVNLTANGTSIYIGDARNSAISVSSTSTPYAFNTAEQISFQYYYAPATTSAITFKLQAATQSGSQVRIGGSFNSDSAVCSSSPSTITVMEVAG
jgi:hypothetical protein